MMISTPGNSWPDLQDSMEEDRTMKATHKLVRATLVALLVQQAAPAQAKLLDHAPTQLQTAFEQCQNALTEFYDYPQEHRIHARPAFEASPLEATFWLNATTKMDGKEVEIKARCTSDLNGGIKSLRVAEGHWR